MFYRQLLRAQILKAQKDSLFLLLGSGHVKAVCKMLMKLSPGVVHNDKIFIIDDVNPEVFDPKNNHWSQWPKPIKKADYSCMISWKDSILVFGGISNEHGVQSFNTTLNSWSVLNAGIPPFQLVQTTCFSLPKNQVLLVGSRNDGKSSALFDIHTNSWENLEDSEFNRHGSTVVNLNGRIFVINAKNYVVEEYHYETKTWTEVEERITKKPYFSSALALPGVNFTNVLRTNIVLAAFSMYM